MKELLVIVLVCLAVILGYMLGLNDGLATEDWLDCIEFEECPIDKAVAPAKVIRT